MICLPRLLSERSRFGFSVMASPSSSAALWALDEAGSLRLRQWDDEAVVYHRPSGATHLVDEVSALILRTLEQGAMSLAGLAARVGETLGVGSPEELEQITGERLAGLQRLGIVVCLPGDHR